MKKYVVAGLVFISGFFLFAWLNGKMKHIHFTSNPLVSAFIGVFILFLFLNLLFSFTKKAYKANETPADKAKKESNQLSKHDVKSFVELGNEFFKHQVDVKKIIAGYGYTPGIDFFIAISVNGNEKLDKEKLKPALLKVFYSHVTFDIIDLNDPLAVNEQELLAKGQEIPVNKS